MISLEDLFFSYHPDGPTVFRNLTLKIECKSWTVLTGPDGSGKTTLARLLMGLLRPDSGSLRLDSAGGDSFPTVGYLGGDPYDCLVGVSVEEDVVFGLENQRLPPQEIRERLRQALAWTGLTGLEQRLVHTLSGGEQQKLALASALAVGARIIIIDEALSMMDRPARADIREVLTGLRRDLGLSLIEMTHDFEDALTADRMIFLSGGEILFDGPPADFPRTALGNEWISLVGGMSGLRTEMLGLGAACGHNSEGSVREVLCNYKVI